MDITIKVETAMLRDRIQENRDKHRMIFEDALDGFRAQVIAQLEARLEQMRNGKMIELAIRLPQPVDHTEDYDRVLDMLDMHVKDTIDISNDEFAMYVRDDWAWKREFAATTSNYTTLR